MLSVTKYAKAQKAIAFTRQLLVKMDGGKIASDQDGNLVIILFRVSAEPIVSVSSMKKRSRLVPLSFRVTPFHCMGVHLEDDRFLAFSITNCSILDAINVTKCPSYLSLFIEKEEKEYKVLYLCYCKQRITNTAGKLLIAFLKRV